MAVIRINAEIPRDTNLPEDVAVNVWHFSTSSNIEPARSTEVQLALDELELFYGAVDQFLSLTTASPGTFTAYDLSEAKPRVPFISRDFTLVPGGGAFPGEVALTLSFQGVEVSGEPQARRRGRIYLGPLSSDTWVLSGGTSRPTFALQDGLRDAGQALLTASEAAATWSWIVFSPTSAGPVDPVTGLYANLADGVVVVDNGWVDDAFDTIRKRGPAASSRLVFS